MLRDLRGMCALLMQAPHGHKPTHQVHMPTRRDGYGMKVQTKLQNSKNRPRINQRPEYQH